MENISVGDLVMIVKLTPCCSNGSLGLTFVVDEISSTYCRCTYCNLRGYTLDARIKNTNNWVEVQRLKKIPPLSELEDTKTQETLEV